MLVLKIGSTTSLSTGVLWFFCRLEAQLGETVVSASAGALSVLYPAHGVLIMVSLRLVPQSLPSHSWPFASDLINQGAEQANRGVVQAPKSI